VLGLPYRLVKTASKNYNPFWRYSGAATYAASPAAPPAVYVTKIGPLFEG